MKVKYALLATILAGIWDSNTAASHLSKFHGLRAVKKKNFVNQQEPPKQGGRRLSKPWEYSCTGTVETCGKSDTKLLMCHRQGDGKYKSICVSETAASARLRKGDTCGRCTTCNDDNVCTIDIEGVDGSCTNKPACDPEKKYHGSDLDHYQNHAFNRDELFHEARTANELTDNQQSQKVSKSFKSSRHIADNKKRSDANSDKRMTTMLFRHFRFFARMVLQYPISTTPLTLYQQIGQFQHYIPNRHYEQIDLVVHQELRFLMKYYFILKINFLCLYMIHVLLFLPFQVIFLLVPPLNNNNMLQESFSLLHK